VSDGKLLDGKSAFDKDEEANKMLTPTMREPWRL